MSIALTVDALVRALRWKAHELAEKAEMNSSELGDGARQAREGNNDSRLR
ncbi:hypothetical protein ACFPLB_05130 [Aquamicrobium segne]|uniref:Uncharacterized protein n=1 Tax=Aquamicrobium segne TaxID=469547 RepID=A0ABW0GVT4_9HYPH